MSDRSPEPAPERLSPNALDRRVKRWWLAGPYETYVQVTPGLEHVLVNEALASGLISAEDEARIDRGGVSMNLDPAAVLRANLSLRTASRVLLRLGTFPAASVEMLYDRARRLPWEVHLGFHTSYSLHVTARGSNLQAGDEVANTVASAVSRHMRELGLYPKQAEGAPLEFHVRLLNDYCTISLNTSGELLHRRGFRRHVHAAPVRETLAGAMVLTGLAGMDEPPDVIVDPFCGSGTLLMEAADVLQGQPPGRARAFAFEQTAWFRPGRWREVQRQAERAAGSVTDVVAGGPDTEDTPTDDAVAAAPSAPPPKLLGFDFDPQALAAARANLASEAYRAVEVTEADSTRLDFGSLGVKRGLVVSNLPYGVRLGEERTAAETTRRFLAQLAASGVPWRVVLLTTPAEADVAQQLLDTEQVVATKNGGLDVRLVVGAVGRGYPGRQ
ncbi:MAG: hypothetical protein WCY60_01220 [Trueperaceae bacterium]